MKFMQTKFVLNLLVSTLLKNTESHSEILSKYFTPTYPIIVYFFFSKKSIIQSKIAGLNHDFSYLFQHILFLYHLLIMLFYRLLMRSN